MDEANLGFGQKYANTPIEQVPIDYLQWARDNLQRLSPYPGQACIGS